jgi:hypothetical protein
MARCVLLEGCETCLDSCCMGASISCAGPGRLPPRRGTSLIKHHGLYAVDYRTSSGQHPPAMPARSPTHAAFGQAIRELREERGISKRRSRSRAASIALTTAAWSVASVTRASPASSRSPTRSTCNRPRSTLAPSDCSPSVADDHTPWLQAPNAATPLDCCARSHRATTKRGQTRCTPQRALCDCCVLRANPPERALQGDQFGIRSGLVHLVCLSAKLLGAGWWASSEALRLQSLSAR